MQYYKPRPAPIDRIKNKYRWRIILKGNVDKQITSIIHIILNKTYASTNKSRVIVDINPTNMM